MQPKIVVPLIAAGLAASFVAWGLPTGSVAAAGGTNCVALLDSDEDFLPDAVEWVVLTNAANPDTDGDGTPDFVEIVEAGRPRHANAPLPADQQMRMIITGPSTSGAGADPRTWMHIFHRVMTSNTGVGAGASAIQSFDTWLERPLWPGVRFPLNAFAAGGIVYRERVTATDGIWVQLSIPLVSEAILSAVLPCTIWAETTVAGQPLASGMKLINLPDGIASIVPFGDGRFVLQTLSPIPAMASSVSGSSGSVGHPNQVCVLDLEEQSTGPGGTTYQVAAADCESANELECSSSCQASVGWTITIPGGTELIGGR